MATEAPVVSIIILSYKTPDYLDICLRSVRMHTKDVLHELIIPYESPDPDTEKVLQEYEQMVGTDGLVRLLAIPLKGMKYAQGNAEAIPHCQSDSIIFLNSDTIVTPHWVSIILSVYESNKHQMSIGLVGTMGTNTSGPQDVSHGWKTAPFKCPRVVTMCAMIRKATLSNIGGWDILFPSNNYTDDDLCVRLVKNGYSNLVAPVCIFHFGGRSFVENKIEFKPDMKIGEEYMATKHGKDWKAVYYENIFKPDGDKARK